MNATGAVISHWPWSIRAQIHRWCHWRLISLFCSILWVTFYRSMKNMSISTEKRRMLLTNNYWRMQLTNPKVNGVILQVMLCILNNSSPVLWSFILFNISCINFFLFAGQYFCWSECHKLVILLKEGEIFGWSFERKWDFWPIFHQKLWSIREVTVNAWNSAIFK